MEFVKRIFLLLPFFIKMRFSICFLFILNVIGISAQEIRILTLNVLNSIERKGWNEYNWSGNDGKTRGQKVVDVILQSEADIVCVQEYVHNNEWLKDELERTTGSNWNIRILPRNCAIISKYPILPHGNMFLTPVKISDCKIINVISAHQYVYTYVPYALQGGQTVEEACREAIRVNHTGYWKAMVEEIVMAQNKEEIVILAGDFNEPSHLDYSVKSKNKGYVKSEYLLGMMSNVLLDDMHMKDVWNEKRKKEGLDECTLRGITWSPTTWEYKRGVDDHRIDFIYYTANGISFIDAKLIGETPVIEIPGDKVDLTIDRWPSDHRGVLAILNIEY